MKALTEANIYDASPEFRIIFFPAQSSDHLKIPPTFNKKLEGVFPSDYLLESSGKTWHVTVKEVHDNLLQLENGWPEFVKDSALAEGDFLVFSYIGNLKFHVGIWDKNGCRRKIQDSNAGEIQNICEYPASLPHICEHTKRPRKALEQEDKVHVKDCRRFVGSKLHRRCK
ncbi:putative B3 domain-containing protein At5g66980 isoform X2 [Daucus carota subsp. sativus]|uniref:putative B3 domain-containing protein At5g66980 isoform X2 n=1 Tax=Daucus carota subsp. sativus TaxID=79200 RepID=UPI0030837D6E